MAKNPRGRPSHRPTEESMEIVRRMAGILGATHDQISKVLNIDGKTLRKHYADILENEAHRISSAIAANLVNIARGTSQQAVTAAIFYLKSRNKWIDRHTTEISGPGGEPLKVETTTKIDAANLDPEQRDALRALLLAAAAKKDQA